MSGGSEEDEGATSLEYTPTWVVAAVCTVIVAVSLALERLLHYGGIYLKKTNQKPLFEALQKVKEELMLLGFISLLLTVSQNAISKICVPYRVVQNLLPCKLNHRQPPSKHIHRTLLSSSEAQIGYCAKHNKVSLLSVEALHHLHIFIFVLAIVHVTFCVLTVLFGGAKIRKWKRWEESIAKANYASEHAIKPKVTRAHQHTFIREHFLGTSKNSVLLGWLHSFVKQFHASVTKSDYVTLRLGFIMTHCRGNLKFNFHKYMVRALEDDFKIVVGISWYLWIFVVIFLLLNVSEMDRFYLSQVSLFLWSGWHTYFWIAFFPFVLLLAVGTKLEHVITQLANEVDEKHLAIGGELVVKPSDGHFWFRQPRIVLFLIHFILFQNAFEIGFFFWIWVQYGFDSCIMGNIQYIIPRLIIGVFIQVLCSYSTLPLYAIITQMGSSFKKAIFDEHVQVGLVGWAQKVKKKRGLKAATEGSVSGSGPSPGQAGSNSGSSMGIQLGGILNKTNTPQEISPVPAPDGSR